MKQSHWWKCFTAAPHRMLFLGGTAQLVIITGWWCYDLFARYVGGLPYRPPVIGPVPAHLLLMIDGFMPFYIFGFLFTAGPRWLNVEAPGKKAYVPLFLLLALAAIGMDTGVMFSPSLLTSAIMLLLFAWGGAGCVALRLLRQGAVTDKTHARAVIAGIWFGLAGLMFYLAWLLTGRLACLTAARITGIWLFLLPVFASVCHRMIPFFSSRLQPAGTAAWRPYWLLWLMLAGCLAHCFLELTDRQFLLWTADLPMAAAVIAMVVRWHFWRSFQDRLLAMLHVAFGWLGIALALYALQSLCMMFRSDHAMLFGLAPLHALTLGYFVSMLLAMASRVSLGHSGQPLAASPITWGVFVFFQLVTLLRVLPDVLGNVPPTGFYTSAALLAFGCLSLWSAKFVPLYLKPRADGRHG